MKRNTKFVNLHKQRGIVGLVLVAITLIGAVIAAFAMMGRNSATGVADQTSKTNVSIMMKQAADYRAGFDRMLVNGAAASTITFNNTVGTGLFDPTPGAQYAILQNPPAGIVASGTTPTFTYTQLVNLPGIGASATADYVATVGHVTLPNCQQLNKLLWGDASTLTPATSAGSLAAWTTTPAAVDDSAQTATTNYNGRPEGCIKTSDGNYVYYKALAEN
jgi:hypothetical protein